ALLRPSPDGGVGRRGRRDRRGVGGGMGAGAQRRPGRGCRSRGAAAGEAGGEWAAGRGRAADQRGRGGVRGRGARGGGRLRPLRRDGGPRQRPARRRSARSRDAGGDHQRAGATVGSPDRRGAAGDAGAGGGGADAGRAGGRRRQRRERAPGHGDGHRLHRGGDAAGRGGKPVRREAHFAGPPGGRGGGSGRPRRSAALASRSAAI
ncbi:MAG: Adenosylcobinamide amidohydrolase, partial [uncultured Gemmatimonadetes bacterium]